MDEVTFTIDGLDALRTAAAALPDRVEAATKAVAQSTAARVLAGARARWLAQRKAPGTALADAMTLREDAANQQFVVESPAPRGQPASLPIWLSYGTVKMPARPYLAPAAEAEDAQYASDMEAAALAPVREVLEG